MDANTRIDMVFQALAIEDHREAMVAESFQRRLRPKWKYWRRLYRGDRKWRAGSKSWKLSRPTQYRHR